MPSIVVTASTGWLSLGVLCKYIYIYIYFFFLVDYEVNINIAQENVGRGQEKVCRGQEKVRLQRELDFADHPVICGCIIWSDSQTLRLSRKTNQNCRDEALSHMPTGLKSPEWSRSILMGIGVLHILHQ